ncbi:MAG TPA: 3'-5' exonuclease, partial [bacterium]|nr:3'-5' exonuclease [bacterium]
DVGILLRHWRQARAFAEPFRQLGIPSYLVRGVGFYERPEIIDLCSFLAFVKDPGDDLALATVLTSPLAGGNFADLWTLSQARKQSRQPLYQVLSDSAESSLPGDIAGRLSPFLALCREALRLRDRLTPAEILELALERSGYEGVMAALEGGEQRLANAGKLIEMARLTSRQGLSTLSQFADRMREHVSSMTRAPEAPIYGENENVVRMMTVHQAKGLEFEAVIVPSLGGKVGRDETYQAVFDDALGVVCTAASGPNRALLPNTLMERSLRVEKDRRLEEEKRLLYVATTRARRILVLSEGFSSGHGPWMKWIRDAIGWSAEIAAGLEQKSPPTTAIELPGVSVELLGPVCVRSRTGRPVSESLQVPVEAAHDVEEPGEEEIEAASARAFHWSAPRPRIIELTPSALEDLSLCSRYYFLSQKASLRDRPGPFSPSSSPILEGEIVHRILRRLDRSLPLEDAQCRERELSRLLELDESAALLTLERRREMISHLSRYVGSSSWHTLQGNPALQREVPFQIRLDGRDVTLLISGRMDALAPDPQDPIVIETKYAAYDPEQAQNYRLSATIYALAALRHTGSERARTRLLFLRSDPDVFVEFVVDRSTEVEKELMGLAADYSHRTLGRSYEDWPRIEPTRCDEISCAFRSFCWGEGRKS